MQSGGWLPTPPPHDGGKNGNPKKDRKAKHGAEVFAETRGVRPTPFPPTMGPNWLRYVREVIESGLTGDMVSRFEGAFAKALGIKHCIATPGCTPSLAILPAAFDFEPSDEIIVSPVTDSPHRAEGGRAKSKKAVVLIP